MVDNKTLAAIRRDYRSRSLNEKDISADPILQFSRWLSEALEAEVNEPNAMHLATVNAEGRPEGRIVLLKGADARGLSFFTNYNSAKGRQLAMNPYAALTFFWPELERQVNLEGPVSKLTDADNDEYFMSRPRGSRISAWVSDQSEVVENREWLEKKRDKYEKQFEDKEVTRPGHWGGYVLKPVQIEFWQGRADRLHDRLQYVMQPDNTWLIRRLSP